MCIDIHTWHLGCDCSYYQNTWQCHHVRRCNPWDFLTLPATVALPAPLPKIPPGLMGCTVKEITRPQWGDCPACTRKKENAAAVARAKARADADGNADAPEDGTDKNKKEEEKKKLRHVTVTRVGGVPVLSLSDFTFTDTAGDVYDEDRESPPDGESVARLRDSFMQLAEEYDPSSSKA